MDERLSSDRIRAAIVHEMQQIMAEPKTPEDVAKGVIMVTLDGLRDFGALGEPGVPEIIEILAAPGGLARHLSEGMLVEHLGYKHTWSSNKATTEIADDKGATRIKVVTNPSTGEVNELVVRAQNNKYSLISPNKN